MIDYDRLTLGGTRKYYVSFNNVRVGTLLGNGLVSCIAAWHVAKPQVIVMRGDPTDNNATLFADGYLAVLKPKFTSKAYVDVANPAGTWTPATALTEFQAAFTAHPNANAVLMPNDENGAPIIHYLQTKGIKPKTFPVTGQDATLTGLQNVICRLPVRHRVQADLPGGAGRGRAGHVPAGRRDAAEGTGQRLGDGREHPHASAVDPGEAGVGRAVDGPVHGHQGRLRARVPAVLGLLRQGGLHKVRHIRVIDDRIPSRREPLGGNERLRGWHPARGRGPGAIRLRLGPTGPGPAGDGDMPLLRLENIGKSFGPVQALSGIDLDIPVGQVTALAGDNGAGKSTLIKCIAGIYQPSSGQLLWQGRPVHLHSPRDATSLGIATVYQDLALADNMDIVANMLLGHEKTRFGLLDEINMELTAKQTLKDLRVTTVRSIRQPVGSLSGGQRQAVAVAKAVMQEARLVIMDEPTAALGVTQTELVLSLIEQLASRGIAVLVVSHNLTDVFRVANRIAVLYLGKLASVGPASDYDTASVVDLMTTGASARLHNGSGSESAASGNVSTGSEG